MKTLILILMSFTAMAQSPCKDSTYLHYKSLNVDSLTSRQYQYMMTIDSQCATIKQNKEQTKSAVNTMLATGVITTLLLVLIPIIIIR